MTVMHQPIILAAPMPLPPPPPPPPGSSFFFCPGWQIPGEGDSCCHIPYGMPKCYATGIKKPSWPPYLHVYSRVQLLAHKPHLEVGVA